MNKCLATSITVMIATALLTYSMSPVPDKNLQAQVAYMQAELAKVNESREKKISELLQKLSQCQSR